MDNINRCMKKIGYISNEKWFKYTILFTLLVFSTGIDLIHNYKITNNIKNVYMVLIPFILVLIMIGKKQLNRDVNWIFYGMVLFSMISVIWSVDRVETIKNSILFAGTTIIAAYVAKNSTKEEIFEVLLTWFMWMVIINLLCYMIKLPVAYDFKETRYTVALKGIYKHRNTLGLQMTLSISLTIWYLTHFWKDKLLRNKCILTLIGSVFLLYMSKSMTSYLLVGAMVTLVILTRYKLFNKLMIYATVPALVVSIYLLIGQPPFFQNFLLMIGRSPTLTDRTVIWAGSIAGIKTKPLLGYGYSAYLTNNIYAVNFVAVHYGGLPVNSHNGFLDILLDFGVAGGSLIFLFMINTLDKIRRLNNKLSRIDFKYIGFILAYFGFTLFHNLVESPLVKHNATTYVLIILFFNIIYRTWREVKNS